MNDVFRRSSRRDARSISWSNAAAWCLAIALMAYVGTILGRAGVREVEGRRSPQPPAPALATVYDSYDVDAGIDPPRVSYATRDITLGPIATPVVAVYPAVDSWVSVRVESPPLDQVKPGDDWTVFSAAFVILHGDGGPPHLMQHGDLKPSDAISLAPTAVTGAANRTTDIALRARVDHGAVIVEAKGPPGAVLRTLVSKGPASPPSVARGDGIHPTRGAYR